MSQLTALLVTALVALFIYLAILFVLLPLYRQRQRYTQYMPISLPSHMQPHSIRDWVLDRLSAYSDPLAAHFHRRSYSGLSDEEMIDPIASLEDLRQHDRYEEQGRGRTATRADRGDDQRRLSRDLEAGFRDDSDDEEEDGRGRS